MVLSIIMFFVFCIGLGSLVSPFLKESEDFLERWVIRVGIGLGSLVVLLLVLNLFHIPLHYITVLFVVAIGFAVWKWKGKDYHFKINWAYSIIVLLLFSGTLYMYTSGAFSYGWLEDDDPWGHIVGVKYIADEMSAFRPVGLTEKIAYYVDPYPPGYDAVLAVLSQTPGASLLWTVKFFNALFCSLGILFFYFFAKSFTGSENKALYGTIVLAMIPCYLSHFIWAHSLIVTLFFPTLYCLSKIKDDTKWVIPSIIMIISLFCLQPEQAVKFGLFFFLPYYIITLFRGEKGHANMMLLGAIPGVIIGFFLWYFPAFMRHGIMPVLKRFGLTSGAYGIAGSADKAYSFTDYFIANPSNMINNPIGWGWGISILFGLSILFYILFWKKAKVNSYRCTILLWFIICFLAVNSWTLINLYPFRVWMLLAIPVSLIIGDFVDMVIKILRGNKYYHYVAVVVLIILLFFAGGLVKYQINTMPWSAGQGVYSQEHMEGILFLKTLPMETKVFPIDFSAAQYVIAMDKETCEWCPEILQFRDKLDNLTNIEIHDSLMINGYEYVFFDQTYVQHYGINQSNQLLKKFDNPNAYSVVFNKPGVIILRVI